MKSNLKWFLIITTITSYLKTTSKIQEKGSLKSKVSSNSSFVLSNFLCIARNLEKKNKQTNHFFPRDKNTTTLYIQGYILWFSYAFKGCSNSMSKIPYIHPMIVVGTVVMH